MYIKLHLLLFCWPFTHRMTARCAEKQIRVGWGLLLSLVQRLILPPGARFCSRQLRGLEWADMQGKVEALRRRGLAAFYSKF